MNKNLLKVLLMCAFMCSLVIVSHDQCNSGGLVIGWIFFLTVGASVGGFIGYVEGYRAAIAKAKGQP